MVEPRVLMLDSVAVFAQLAAKVRLPSVGLGGAFEVVLRVSVQEECLCKDHAARGVVSTKLDDYSRA
jgi:hypothetical protein